jgi:hypothetical protein
MRALLLLILIWSSVSRQTVRAAEGRASEYELKAAFIFNFSQFVEWPTNAFQSESEPMIIGVVGPDPFGPILDRIIQDEKVRGRSLKVERYARPADIKRCHILFVSKALAAQWPEIHSAVQGQPILTVSDMDRFSSRDGMIHLVTERNLVRMRVNPEAARRADLSISSKLLRLADNTTRDGGVKP